MNLEKLSADELELAKQKIQDLEDYARGRHYLTVQEAAFVLRRSENTIRNNKNIITIGSKKVLPLIVNSRILYSLRDLTAALVFYHVKAESEPEDVLLKSPRGRKKKSGLNLGA